MHMKWDVHFILSIKTDLTDLSVKQLLLMSAGFMQPGLKPRPPWCCQWRFYVAINYTCAAKYLCWHNEKKPQHCITKLRNTCSKLVVSIRTFFLINSGFLSSQSNQSMCVTVSTLFFMVEFSNTFEYNVHAPMRKFQLQLIYYFTYFSPSSHLTFVCFFYLGISLLIHFQQVL